MIFSEFLDNPQTKRYYEIIENARLFPLPTDTYTEKHHILPNSFYKAGLVTGNPYDPINIVILTGREHFICHQLLTEMLPIGPGYYKMSHAFFGMCRTGSKNIGRYIPTPEEYELAKILSAIAMSKLHKNKLKSAEAKANMSKALKGKLKSAETKANMSKASKGKSKSAEHCANMSKPRSAEAKANMSKAHLGHKHSDETKAKMSKPKSSKSISKGIATRKANREAKLKSDDFKNNLF